MIFHCHDKKFPALDEPPLILKQNCFIVQCTNDERGESQWSAQLGNVFFNIRESKKTKSFVFEKKKFMTF